MLYINGRFLTQPLTGVNRFAYELTCALIQQGVDIIVVCPPKELISDYDISQFTIIKFGFGTSHVWEQFSLPFFFVGKGDYLLLNFTGAGPIAISNKIITIHDLAFLENPSWYSRSYVILYKFLTPLSAKTSKRILTVSEFSKKEITNKLGINSEKIEVIYNAATKCESENKSILSNVPERFLLAVSSIDPRKNFERLVRVFSHLCDYNLVVVGSGYRSFSGVNIKTDSKNIFFLGRVSDAELTSLYKKAMAFIYPSLYEGFGIPPIEAMSYGCPVVVSDIDVLHEVCGEAALYIDQLDEIDIKNKVEEICNNPSLRDDLRGKGYKNINRFSWESSANKLQQLLETL